MFITVFPEMMFFIPKHIEYNYYHYSFIRTTRAQNTIITLLLCEVSTAILDFILNLPKVTKAATKLNLLIYPPTIKLLWLYLYNNNTSTNAKIAHSVVQVKGSHLGYYIDSIVNLKIYCQK